MVALNVNFSRPFHFAAFDDGYGMCNFSGDLYSRHVFPPPSNNTSCKSLLKTKMVPRSVEGIEESTMSLIRGLPHLCCELEVIKQEQHF